VSFLESNQEARLYLSFVVAGELAAGTSMKLAITPPVPTAQ